jgi:hypothetical protein
MSVDVAGTSSLSDREFAAKPKQFLLHPENQENQKRRSESVSKWATMPAQSFYLTL